jgi:hypothetical protein
MQEAYVLLLEKPKFSMEQHGSMSRLEPKKMRASAEEEGFNSKQA